MTQIFAFSGYVDNKPVLFAGADGEGTIDEREKDSTIQKLFVVGDYFLMGTGSWNLVAETAVAMMQEAEKITSTKELTEKVFEYGQRFTDKDTRIKQGKMFLTKTPASGLDFIIAGKNSEKTGFDIYKADINGFGFTFNRNLHIHEMDATKFEGGIDLFERTALSGSGTAGSGPILEAIHSRSSEGIGALVKIPKTESDAAYNMLLHTYIAVAGATAQGVNSQVQYGFMTLDNGLTTLYPTETTFLDMATNGEVTMSSSMMKAYLRNLFKTDITNENLFDQKENADKIHARFTTSLRHLRNYGQETVQMSTWMGNVLGRQNQKDYNPATAQELITVTSRRFHQIGAEIHKFTQDLIKRGPVLNKYAR